MLLSIVMPCYNEEQFLEEIVRRVQAVDLGDMERELVIIDDCSTDGTPGGGLHFHWDLHDICFLGCAVSHRRWRAGWLREPLEA